MGGGSYYSTFSLNFYTGGGGVVNGVRGSFRCQWVGRRVGRRKVMGGWMKQIGVGVTLRGSNPNTGLLCGLPKEICVSLGRGL